MVNVLLRDIPIELLEEPPWADEVRAFRDAMVDLLARTIVDTGWIQPLTVLRRRDGSLMIVDGVTRYRAARFLRLDDVPCILADEEDLGMDPMEFAVKVNCAQGTLGTVSRLRLVEMYVGRGVSVERACSMVFRSKAWYYKYRGILRLPREVQVEIERGLAPLPKEGETEEIESTRYTRKRGYGRGYRRGGEVSEKVICPVCGAKLVGDAERHWQAFCPGHWREVRFLLKTTRRDTLVGGRVVFQCPRCRYEMMRP